MRYLNVSDMYCSSMAAAVKVCFMIHKLRQPKLRQVSQPETNWEGKATETDSAHSMPFLSPWYMAIMVIKLKQSRKLEVGLQAPLYFWL